MVLIEMSPTWQRQGVFAPFSPKAGRNPSGRGRRGRWPQQREEEAPGARGAAGCAFHPELIDECWSSSALGSGLRGLPRQPGGQRGGSLPSEASQAVGAAGETSCVHHAVPWWGQQMSEYPDVRWFHHQPLCWRKGDAVRLMGESQ